MATKTAQCLSLDEDDKKTTQDMDSDMNESSSLETEEKGIQDLFFGLKPIVNSFDNMLCWGDSFHHFPAKFFSLEDWLTHGPEMSYYLMIIYRMESKPSFWPVDSPFVPRQEILVRYSAVERYWPDEHEKNELVLDHPDLTKLTPDDKDFIFQDLTFLLKPDQDAKKIRENIRDICLKEKEQAELEEKAKKELKAKEAQVKREKMEESKWKSMSRNQRKRFRKRRNQQRKKQVDPSKEDEKGEKENDEDKEDDGEGDSDEESVQSYYDSLYPKQPLQNKFSKKLFLELVTNAADPETFEVHTGSGKKMEKKLRLQHEIRQVPAAAKPSWAQTKKQLDQLIQDTQAAMYADLGQKMPEEKKQKETKEEGKQEKQGVYGGLAPHEELTLMDRRRLKEKGWKLSNGPEVFGKDLPEFDSHELEFHPSHVGYNIMVACPLNGKVTMDLIQYVKQLCDALYQGNSTAELPAGVPPLPGTEFWFKMMERVDDKLKPYGSFSFAKLGVQMEPDKKAIITVPFVSIETLSLVEDLLFFWNFQVLMGSGSKTGMVHPHDVLTRNSPQLAKIHQHDIPMPSGFFPGQVLGEFSKTSKAINDGKLREMASILNHQAEKHNNDLRKAKTFEKTFLEQERKIQLAKKHTELAFQELWQLKELQLRKQEIHSESKSIHEAAKEMKILSERLTDALPPSQSNPTENKIKLEIQDEKLQMDIQILNLQLQDLRLKRDQDLAYWLRGVTHLDRYKEISYIQAYQIKLCCYYGHGFALPRYFIDLYLRNSRFDLFAEEEAFPGSSLFRCRVFPGTKSPRTGVSLSDGLKLVQRFFAAASRYMEWAEQEDAYQDKLREWQEKQAAHEKEKKRLQEAGRDTSYMLGDSYPPKRKKDHNSWPPHFNLKKLLDPLEDFPSVNILSFWNREGSQREFEQKVQERKTKILSGNYLYYDVLKYYSSDLFLALKYIQMFAKGLKIYDKYRSDPKLTILLDNPFQLLHMTRIRENGLLWMELALETRNFALLRYVFTILDVLGLPRLHITKQHLMVLSTEALLLGNAANALVDSLEDDRNEPRLLLEDALMFREQTRVKVSNFLDELLKYQNQDAPLDMTDKEVLKIIEKIQTQEAIASAKFDHDQKHNPQRLGGTWFDGDEEKKTAASKESAASIRQLESKKEEKDHHKRTGPDPRNYLYYHYDDDYMDFVEAEYEADLDNEYETDDDDY